MYRLVASIFSLICSGTLFAQVEPSEKAGSMPLILDMVHHNSGEPPYESRYNDPAELKKMGYTGKVYFLFESPQLAVDWESVDPAILPKGSKAREWVDQKAADLHNKYKTCQAAGIKVYAQCDLVLFPKTLIKKYGMEKTFGDPQNEQTQKYLRLLLQQIFDQFPEVDGLVVRIGETYLHDAPYHSGSIKGKASPYTTIIPLMNLLREEICVKANKQLIFRTWRSFEKTRKYKPVSAGVEPHENLHISVKHCSGDFHRTNPFHAALGLGRHKQIVEIQCAREYEGKGAYPNYILNGVIEGFEEYEFLMKKDRMQGIRELYKTGKLAGVWTWTRGGGWSGPYIKNELWCDLNAWVTAQWALNPEEAEEAICNRYARERLGLKGDDVTKFRKLCLLSAAAVLRGRNSTHRDMIPWWTRDQGIAWPMYQKEHDYARNLKQKDESVAMWKEIVRLAKEINWGDDVTRIHAVSSSRYGQHLYEIYRSLLYLADAVEKKDNEAIRKWLKAYDDSWATYNKLPETYPELSTLYTEAYSRHIREPAYRKVEEIRKSMK